MKAPSLVSLFGALSLLVAGAAWAGDPVPEVDVILEQVPGGVVVESRSGGFDEVELKLGKDLVRALSALDLPAGWSLESKGKKARLAGPALPGGWPVRLELDAGSAPRPERLSYRVRLEGRTLLERKNVPVEPVPPRQVVGSLQGVVTMPSQVAPGEPMRMQVSGEADLPPGGTWTLSGTVVEEEHTRGAGDKRRVALAVSHEHADALPDRALSDVAATLAASGTEARRWEVVPVGVDDPALEEDGLEVWLVGGEGEPGERRRRGRVTRLEPGAVAEALRSLRDAGGEAPAASAEAGVYLVQPAVPSPGTRTRVVVDEERMPSRSRAASGDEAGLIVNEEEVRVGLELEPVSGSGSPEEVTLHFFEVTGDPDTEGMTTLFTNHNSTRSNKKSHGFAPADTAGAVDLVVPEGIEPGEALALRYIDAFGDVVVDVPEVPGVEVVEPTGGDRPRLTDAMPRSIAGQRTCVCGIFPGPEAWSGLLFDGEAAGAPVVASSSMAWVRLPAAIAPGEHVFTGTAEAGFPAGDRAVTRVLRVTGQLDARKLQRLQSTPMRLEIEGTEEPVRLRVRNLSPGIISLEGGDDQEIRTSGGTPNQLERTVRGLSPGRFDIRYEMAAGTCPCGGS